MLHRSGFIDQNTVAAEPIFQITCILSKGRSATVFGALPESFTMSLFGELSMMMMRLPQPAATKVCSEDQKSL